MAKTSKKLIIFSRKLRKELTKPEAVIWQKLRASQVNGLKFRRQHPIGQFITDFYCDQKKLIIEIDGDVHDLPEKRVADQRKDKYFFDLGYKVLRINNDDVFNNLNGVMAMISSF